MRSAIANKAMKTSRANLSRLRFKISLHDTAPTIRYGITFQPKLPERFETVRSNSSIRRVRCEKIGTKKKKANTRSQRTRCREARSVPAH